MIICSYLKTGEGEDDDDYFFHEPIRKVYTWLNFFAQPSVVMVVTNIRSVKTYAECDEYIWIFELVTNIFSDIHSYCGSEALVVKAY